MRRPHARWQNGVDSLAARGRDGAVAGGGHPPLALDVTDEASIRAAVQAIEAEATGVDVLVNNAGISEAGAIEEVSLSAGNGSSR